MSFLLMIKDPRAFLYSELIRKNFTPDKDLKIVAHRIFSCGNMNNYFFATFWSSATLHRKGEFYVLEDRY